MLIIAVLFLARLASSFATNSPTWIAHTSFRAGSASLITSVTASPNVLSYTVFFTAAMISNPPGMAIGIKSYKGIDYLLQQFFELTLNNAFSSQFQVGIILQPITTPIYFDISYIAIEADYAYANAYTFIPLNFGGGNLNNLTNVGSSKQTHTELIDYTTGEFYFTVSQAASDTFSTPLSSNVICFFLSALHIISTETNVVQLDLSYSIIDANRYSMSLTAGLDLTISKIEFSKVFYNTQHFSMGARKCMFSYDWLISTPLTASNYFNLPAVAMNSQLIVGIKSLSVPSGNQAIDFNWVSGTYSSYNGIQVSISSTVNSSYTAQVLYYLEWTCPPTFPYTNLVTFLCQDSCPAAYYPDNVNLICIPCSNQLCLTCDSSDSNICLSCPTNWGLNSNTCDCDSASNSKFLVSNTTCLICPNIQAKCILCDYSGSSAVAFDSTKFTCLDCDSTLGYFLNSNSTCVLCSLANCLTCDNLNACSVCNAGFGVNSAGICSTCPIDNCAACYNITACKTCVSPYVLMSYKCSTCPASCTCDGYTFPRKANGDCSAICGDGIIISTYQSCDDNNAFDGDGCSSTCQIESNSSCSGQPSICYLTINFNASHISTQSVFANCNAIVFKFQLTPFISFFNLYSMNWSQLIQVQSSAMALVPDQFSQNSGEFQLTYTYNQTIQKTELNFTFTPSALITSPPYLSKTTPFNLTVNVDPSNDLAAVYCSPQLLTKTSVLNTYMTAQSSIAYVSLFLSIFSLKIIGLQMFGALQVSYLILSDYDYINPVFRQILGRGEVNGLNLARPSQTNPLISNRVVYNGFTSQIFLDNFNFMFYLTLGLVLTGFAMYSVTYMVNKSLQAVKPDDSLKEQSLHSQHSKAAEQYKQKQPKSIMLHRLSKYLLKQVLMTFVIFNMFSMSFAAGLQMKYINQVQPASIIAMLVSMVLAIALSLAQLITDKLEFGEYTSKFNQESSQSNYMMVTALYRFVLGLLMALLNEWNESGIVFTFVSGAFLTYLFYCQPFVDDVQNLRSKAVHCVHVLIMFINYYYRKEANFDEVSASYFLFPAYLQIAAVGAVVCGSSIMLGYQIVKKVKAMLTGKQAVAQGQNIFQSVQAEHNPGPQVETIEGEELEG